MSKIAISPNPSGSGTITLAAPNTNSDATIDIPAASGTIITTASSTGINAAALSTGTVPTARLASGTADSSTYLRGDQTWSTLPASGSWTYITSLTASNSATLDFTTGINNTYAQYVFVITNLIPATDQTDLYFRVSADGGSTFRTTNYAYFAVKFDSNAGGTPGGIAGNAGPTIVLAEGIDNVAGSGGVNGYVYFGSPSTATQPRFNYFTTHTRGLDGTSVLGTTGAALRSTAEAINAVRFYMNSGNITSGTIRLYGIKNS